MTRIFSIMLFTSCMLSCNSNKNPKQITLNKNDTLSTPLYERDTLPNGSIRLRPNYSLTKNDTSNIELDFFDTIPETISSPGEFYTYDTIKLVSNKYIFLTDLVEYAIIKMKGRDIYLRKEHKKRLELREKTYKDVFSGNGYVIIFIHKEIEHSNGATYEIGTLEIKNSKHQTTTKIHGGYKFL